MPTLTVNGKQVTVGDDFMSLPTDQKNSTVDEIAKSLPQRGLVDKLLGIGGERYQTWPERAVRGVASGVGEALESGAELTKKAMTGQYGPTGEGLNQEDPGKIVSAASLGVTGAPEAAEIAGGVVDAASKAKQVREALPTTAENKTSAQAAYKAVADARLIASEGSVNGLVSSIRAGLDDRLITSDGAKRSFKALEQLQKSGGDISGIIGVRQRLGEIKPSEGEDYAAAQHIKEAIDHYIDTLPPGEIVQGDPKFTQAMLEHARASWRSYAQADQVESAMEIGRHQAAVAGTGANTQNAMRQRIRQILDSDKSRGLSPKAREQMENIVMGTWATNTARWAGKYAPSGPVSALTTTMAALGGDIAGGRGMATAAAAAVAIPATIAKYLGTYLTRRQITELENIIRSESPLGRSRTNWIENQPPGKLSQDAAGATALIPALAAIGSSPLAPSQ
jgi:hypothetical protein